MRQLIICGQLIAAVLLAGCCPPCSSIPGRVVGSGRLVTKEFPLSGFSRVEAGSAFRIDITQAPDYGVAVTTDDNVVDDLDISRVGDTLRLRLKPGVGRARVTLRAEIRMPDLRGVTLSGAARATVSGFRSSSDLVLDLSGASTLEGDAQAGDTRVEASGASRVVLRGSGGNLRANGSGASALELAAYPVKDANISLSGASRAVVNASGRLDADLSGGSRVEYVGNPTLGRINTSGGSSIRAR